jgi:hypothetical protein
VIKANSAAVLLALAVVLGAAKGTVVASDNPSQENELKQLTHEWIDAINTKDRAKLDRLMAPDFFLSGWDGSWRVERARWLDNLVHVIDIQDYPIQESVLTSMAMSPR